MSAVVLLMELKIAGGKRDAFIARGIQHRERVLKNEPGCQRFDIVVPDGSHAIQVTQKIGRGETLMVTGFSDRSASAQRSGTFDADLPLPDGGRKASTARIEQVLLITADIGEPLGIAEVRGMAF